MFSYTFLVLIGIIFCWSIVVESASECPEFPDIPKITIDGDDEFSMGRGKILPDSVLKLRCEASYPIYWDFIPPPFSIYEIENELKENNNSNCYNETLVIHGFANVGNGRSGNYTCRSSLYPQLANWKYLHIRDNARLFSAYDHYPDTFADVVGGSEWRIPCPANVKDLGTPKLSQRNDENSAVSVIPLGATVRYDARYGFLLKLSKYKRPQGTYFCNGTFGSTHDSLKLHLSDYNAIPRSAYVQFNGGSFTVTCESDQEIRIGISKAKNLKIVSTQFSKAKSFNYSISYEFKENLNSSQISKGKINCVNVKTKEILHTWSYDFSRSCNCTAQAYRIRGSIENVGEEAFSHLTCTNRLSIHSPSLKYISCGSATKLDLAFRHFDTLNSHEVGSFSPSESHYFGEGYKVFMPYATSAVMCTVDNYVSTFKAIAGVDGYSINPNNLELETVAHLQILHATMLVDYFVGDSMVVFCAAPRQIFSSPLKWSSNKENISDKHWKTNSIEKNWAFVSKLSVTIDADLHRLTCSAPRWNSTKWENVTIEISNALHSDFNIAQEENRCNISHSSPMIVMKRESSKSLSEFEFKLEMHDVTDREVILRSKELKIYLFCRAPYPIEWVFGGEHFDTTNRRIVYETVSQHNSSEKSFSICFENVIILDIANYASTGEFICQKQNDKTPQSSVYIYASAGAAPHLIRAGGHVSVPINEQDVFTELPCQASDSNASVDLYYHQIPGKYVKMDSSHYEAYNPRKGFIMRTSDIVKTAVYVCSLTNETDPEKSITVSFHLVKSTDSNAPASPLHLRYNEEGELSRHEGFLPLLILLVFLVISVLGTQCWLLRKQHKIDAAISPTVGSYMEMDNVHLI